MKVCTTLGISFNLAYTIKGQLFGYPYFASEISWLGISVTSGSGLISNPMCHDKKVSIP